MQLAIGKNYLFESVTGKIYVGELLEIHGPHTVVLGNAAWVAQTGRLHIFMRDGNAPEMEIEPVGTRGVHWAEWSPWPHPLFTDAV